MIRIITLLLLGAAVTFALFVLMAKLIANSDRLPEEAPPTIVVEAVMSDIDSKIKTIDPVPLPPLPPYFYCEAPHFICEATQIEPLVQNTNLLTTNVTIPLVIEFSGPDVDIFPNFIRSYGVLLTPILRIEPVYPAQAAIDGREGWVRLSFTITEIGDVEDVKVIESHPRHIFDGSAQQALKQWKFKPYIRDGKPAKSFNMQVLLNFSLDKSRLKRM